MRTSRIAAVVVASAGLLVLGACESNMAKDGAAEKTVEVGGAPMFPSKTIVENAVNSADHTTLVAAVKAAGLVDTLNSPGPFTVFAPTNAAFDALPAGTVDNLLKPENKDALVNVLTYHVVPGKISAAEVIAMATANGGTVDVGTVSGGTLKLTVAGGGVQVTDENGRSGMVTIADVNQSNGVIHVVDTVLVPK